MIDLPSQRGKLLQLLDSQPRISSALELCLLTIILLPVGTWLITQLSAALASSSGKGHEPPVAPYALPYFQHLFSFLRDPEALYVWIQKHYGTRPVSLIMMNTKFHVFSTASTAAHVFSRSRDFTFEPVLSSMMQNAMGLPAQDSHWFNPPLEKKKKKQEGDEETEDPRVFMESNVNIWMKYLSGKQLDATVEVYLDHFLKSLDKIIGLQNLKNGEWKTGDIHAILSRLIFETSAMTFFGPRLAQIWGEETMWEDYKLFNDVSYIGVRTNAAYKLHPEAGRARDRMLKAFERWCDVEIGDDDEREWNETPDGVWNGKWGLKLNYEKEILARKLAFSVRGRSSVHASFLFAGNLNAMGLATWTLLSVLSEPDRCARFRTEASKCLLSSSDAKGSIQFDTTALQKNSYIHGVWCESIRLGGQMALARVVASDTELEGYLLRKGSVVLLPARMLHYNEAVFPNAKDFKPERWMVPGDDGNDETDISQEEKAAIKERVRKQRASLRAFGGGASMCAGRFAAEKEILSTVAAMLLLLDIEVETGGAIRRDDESQKGFKISLNPRSLGIMDPAGETKVRLRRREIPSQ